MGKSINITNKKFGRLMAVRFVEIRKSNYYWEFSCECGKIVICNKSKVVNGYTQSCGCLRRELTKKRGMLNKKHGDHGIAFYRKWRNMFYRDYNVEISKEWLLYENFKSDMYKSYTNHVAQYGTENTTIERIDNKKGYSKENCRWATWKEQASNRRTNYFITYKGKTLTLKQWSEELGLNYKTLLSRRFRGWTGVDILTKPIIK